ncbi:mannose-6-phosphate isomerase [Clostridia bacterium]|nr:mannose-6-phosphate isomerase [Clostridia bacterium]
MLPFLLKPVFKDYIWGGTRLKTEYGKISDLPVIAESWELSANREGASVIADGPLKGMSFADFVRNYPEECGSVRTKQGEFPLLIKLIDAKTPLSVQVHPDDAYAATHENGAGKTEMWVVLDAAESASLYFGFKDAISPEEFRLRIENNTLTDALYAAPVKRGDVFFIPSGTIHAIGAGILIAEIQQNSATTYRVYDYGRVGADGKPRELHVAKALDVTNLVPAEKTAPGSGLLEQTADYKLTRLAKCGYFTVDRLEIPKNGKFVLKHDSFVSILSLSGDTKGESTFVPAGAGDVIIEGAGDFLLSTT